MTTKSAVRPDENLMEIQELEDRLKEQIDKLEHVRLAALDLKENLSATNSDLSQAVSDHVDWLRHLSERVDTLHMNAFVQMSPKPRVWTGKHGSKYSFRRGHDNVLSEYGWSPIRTRRNSDAASEMSCNW